VNQFDIFDYPFDEEGAHPCVILSRTDYCGRSRVNALYCTSQRQSRPAKPTEVMLDTADGLDWETFCRCDVVLVIETAKLGRKRGRATLERRNAIRDKIRDIYRLAARD
jgi:mRNA-degrading endonuclease toxin of MazEF toxin-antitoxin module